MAKWIGAALLAAVMTAGISTTASWAMDASAEARKAQATDISARQHAQHYRRYANRPYPYYYGRPVYYAPAPFIPIPPLFGYGWEWW